jgi:elongation factor Ts
VQQAIDSLATVIGEKLVLGRVAAFDGDTVVYLHRRASDLPPSVGVLVAYSGADADVARGAAMQVAAMRPQYVGRDDVPADVVENERRIAEATAREEGKPEAALPKIVDGRVGGFYKQVVLLDQPSVQDQKKTVQQVLSDAGVTVTRFARFEVGQV